MKHTGNHDWKMLECYECGAKDDDVVLTNRESRTCPVCNASPAYTLYHSVTGNTSVRWEIWLARQAVFADKWRD